MECVITGNQIKCLNRALVCLAKIGNELVIEALPDKLVLQTLNSSRSAFLSVVFKVQFFDGYRLTGRRAHCSVLLKSACTVFRTSPGNMDRLSIYLEDENASKLMWILDCPNGIRKTYGICCNSEDELQDVAVDRNLMPTHLVVKPRDLTRLLAHFQSSLQEITFIATEPMSTPAGSETKEAKAVEMRSFVDPAKEGTDGALHTQLWIDPTEELQEYYHTGVAADVTFSVKELKAFVAFCEVSEVDMHMYFQKAGYPVLLAPRFGLDDTHHADFDATLVLATCHSSQLRGNDSEQQAASGHSVEGNGRVRQNNSQTGPQQNAGSRASTPGSYRDSDRTVIWSELTGSAERASGGQATAARRSSRQPSSPGTSEEIPFEVPRHPRNQAHNSANTVASSQSSEPTQVEFGQPNRTASLRSKDLNHGAPGQTPLGQSQPLAQEHTSVAAKNVSNWVCGDMEDQDDEDAAADDDYYVESTPPHRQGSY